MTPAIIRRNPSVSSFCVALLSILLCTTLAQAAAPVLQSAVSRMTHGTVGTFDVQLPLTTNFTGSGIECRQVSGGLSIVLTFDTTITSAGTASITGGATTGTPTFSGTTVTVPVTVTAGDELSLALTVKNVKNASGTLASAVINFRTLLGDVRATGSLNTADVNFCRSQVAAGSPVDGSNFRCDIKLTGTLSVADVNLIRTQVGIGTTVAGGVTNNTAPTMTSVSDMTALQGQATPPVGFTVGDAESNLSTLAVEASCSDQTVIPNNAILITGTGNSRNISLTPTVTGNLTTVVVQVTLYCSDGIAVSPSITFNVTVSPAPTIFLATLAPTGGVGKNGSASLGTGTAVLTVSGDQTHANLSYSWTNLSGTDTDDQIFGPGNAGLYDVSLLANPHNLQTDGSILWAFNGNQATDIQIIFSNTAYMTIVSSNFPGGELQGTFQKVVGSQTFTAPATPTPLVINPPVASDASRFLQQAGFGGTYPEITALVNGYAGNPSTSLNDWITAQAKTQQPITPNVAGTTPAYKSVIPAGATNPQPQCTFSTSSWFGDFWSTTQNAQTEFNGTKGDPVNDGLLIRDWWRNGITQPDQLRMRIQTAFSEFFVISEVDSVINYQLSGVMTYWDMLGGDAFGNYRQLLEDVTLHPAMGEYLTMAGNDYNGSPSFAPNENYAREVMQLFSIGLYMLQPDGTLMLDSNGQPIPTYTQPNVTQLANVFTGWNYDPNAKGTLNQYTSSSPAPNGTIVPVGITWLGPMVSDGNYSPSSKQLLVYPNAAMWPGQTQAGFIPANTGDQAGELKFALDNIFNHPNVGPFFCKQMIQRLVTSNPSPAYVYRVAQVFANNGHGVRGDLQAVFTTILTDNEARSPIVRQDPGFGKPREPIIRLMNILRPLRAKSNSGNYWIGSTDNLLAQTIMYSPTVFNFYTPTYQEPGPIQKAGLVSPEFNIIYATTIVQAHNMIYSGIYSPYNTDGTPAFPGTSNLTGCGLASGGFVDGGNYPFTYPAGEVALDFSTLNPDGSGGNGLKDLAASSTGSLLDRVALLLMASDPQGGANQMDPKMYNTILTFVNNSTYNATPLAKAQAAVHLVATSAQASIQR